MSSLDKRLGEKWSRLETRLNYQEMQTRWNSTYYMLLSFLEQKGDLEIFEYELPDDLITHQRIGI